jgi:hypothetical protein
LVILESVRSNLHQCAIHGAASGSSIQPNNSALTVRDVAVLEVPEEQVTVGLGADFDMTGQDVRNALWSISNIPPFHIFPNHSPSMHLQEGALRSSW